MAESMGTKFNFQIHSKGTAILDNFHITKSISFNNKIFFGL